MVTLVLRNVLVDSEKNKIDNVEALTFLNMETLNFLDLGMFYGENLDDNCITSLKSFDKLKWPLLRKL